MKGPYTDQVQSALQYARKAASDCRQNYVGTEHLLVGLIHEKKGAAGIILLEQGIDEKKLMMQIDRFISPQSDVMLDSSQTYSPRAERILENSKNEAKRFWSEEAGTEHVLIAMLNETDCVGTRLLHTMGVNIQKLYGEILTAMGLEPNTVRRLFRD